MEEQKIIGIMIKTCASYKDGCVCGNRYNDGENTNFYVCKKCLEENDLNYEEKQEEL